MQSTAPPTPPQQQDLNKMQQPPQSMYVPTGGSNASGNVRPNQQTAIYRNATNATAPRGGPRGHSITALPPQMYQPQIQPVVMSPYPPYAPRQPTSTIYSSGPPFQFPQHMQANFHNFAPYYFTNSTMLTAATATQHRGPTAVPGGIVQTGPNGPLGGPGATQTQLTLTTGGVLTTAGGQNVASSVTVQGVAPAGTGVNRRKKRAFALDIIHPETHKNILDEIESMSKTQGATNSELDYQEQMSGGSGNSTEPTVVVAQTQTTQELSALSADPNCNNKGIQAMPSYNIDMIPHHRTIATCPVNEMIGSTTPIVSAMSEAPLIEIPSKQQPKKKNKSIDIVAPVEKTDSKTQTTAMPEDDSDIPSSLQPTTNVPSSSFAKTVEDIPSTKAIQTGDIDNIVAPPLTAHGTETKDFCAQQPPPPLQQQQIKTISTSTSTIETLPAVETVTVSTSTVTSSSSFTSLPSTSEPSIASTSHNIQHRTISTNTGPLLANVGTSTMIPVIPPYQPHTKDSKLSQQQPVQKKDSSTTTTAIQQSSNISAISNSNVAAAATIPGASNKTTTAAATETETFVKGKDVKTFKDSTNNNQQQQSFDKMKLNNDNDDDLKSNTATNGGSNAASSNFDTKNTQTIQQQQQKNWSNNSSSNNNNKFNKISDKNENLIDSTSTSQNKFDSSSCSKVNATTASSDIGIDNGSNSDIKMSTKEATTAAAAAATVIGTIMSITTQSSHDETDRASLINEQNVDLVNNNNNAKVLVDSTTTTTTEEEEEEETSTTTLLKQTQTQTQTYDNDDKEIEDIEAGVGMDDRVITTAITTNGTLTPTAAPVSATNTTATTTTSATGTGKIEDAILAPSVKPQMQPLISYNEGQWSPANPDGSKTYDRQQLMMLRQAPASRLKPDVSDESLFVFQSQRSQQQQQPNLMPAFVRTSNKRGQSMGSTNVNVGGSGSMTGGTPGASPYLKQASMSGVNAKNSSKGSKSGMIYLSLSLREDVKLNETENAWRPTHLIQDEITPEQRDKEELKRKIRGILNKLTPEKFETLVEQIMKLQIDTPDKVNDVMVLVFEKAIDEPNFSVSYARLCSRLASEVKAKDEKGVEGSKNNLLLFRNGLLDKTEREFTGNVLNRQAKEQKLQPILDKIHECADPAEKLELQATLEEAERKIRRRSGGTVRFIGELFKISMLTANIIRTCIENLLDSNSEDKLECLCKLLTTVGKKYEESPNQSKEKFYSLDLVIKKMQAIADRKIESTKISSRVRFMLQDVIDLRKNKWVTSRTEIPKTMDQIQKEAKTEQMSNQYMNYNAMLSNKKDDNRRYGSGGGSCSNSSGGNMSFGGGGGVFRRQQQSGEDTWYTQTSKGTRAVDTNKLGQILNYDMENKAPTLGGKQLFQWTHGAAGNSTGPTATTSNSFAALSSLDSNKNSNSGPRNKGSYNKSSMERDRYDRGDGMGSRTGSAHGSRESSSSRNQPPRNPGSSSGGVGPIMQKSASHQSYPTSASVSRPTSKSPQTSSPTLSSTASSAIQQQYPTAPPPPVFGELKEDLQIKISGAISEMVDIAFESNIDDIIPILKKFPENLRWAFIFMILYEYLHLANVKHTQRKRASDIVLFLLNKNFISVDHFKKGYESFCEIAREIVIDVPEAWQYIFQFAGPLINKKIISINDLWNATLQESGMGKKFLKDLLLYCTREMGPSSTRTLWESSNLKWTDFLHKDDVEKFIKDNKFEYIENKDRNPHISVKPDIVKIMERIKEMLSENASSDTIIDYLSGNIGDVDKQFMRGLTSTLCNHAIQYVNKNYKLNQDRFRKVCIPLLQRFTDSKEERELECLYAIQLLINCLEHPPGLLSDIFGELYDADVIPQETFVKWRDSKEEPTGKGVAAKGLNPFFNNVLSAETSDENN